MQDSDTDQLINELYEMLNKLMTLEVVELMEYSTTETCYAPIEGLEAQYNKQAEKVRLIQSAKCKILFYRYPIETYLGFPDP